MDRVKQHLRKAPGPGIMIRNAADLARAGRRKPPQHGDTWGQWTLNAEGGQWSLDLPNERYWIPLGEVTSNAAMNDWIFQLAMKSWVTAEMLGNLILAFYDIFDPQAHLCGGQQEKHLPSNWVNGVLGAPQ